MSDFGNGAWRRSRKERRCEYCYGPIPAGEKHYHFSGIWQGDWQNWRMHAECHDDYDINGDDEISPGDAPMPPRVAEIVKAREAER